MKLTVTHRTAEKKSEIKKIRRDGNVPAVIYSTEGTPEMIVLKGMELNAILRELKPGRLATTPFVLHFGKVQKRALIKDIQYHLTKHEVTHIDFIELHDNVPVTVKVPVTFTGAMECVGIKMGGFLRQVARSVPVQCVPKLIPQEFLVDVADLKIQQAKRVSDVTIPEGVKMLASQDEVLVVVSKR